MVFAVPAKNKKKIIEIFKKENVEARIQAPKLLGRKRVEAGTSLLQ